MYYYINSFHKYLYIYKMPRKSILEFFFEKTEQNVEMSYELNYKVEKVNKQNKKIDLLNKY